ncbi:MAG: fasciclin domain-containing protein [Acidimicrobiales bacterium]|jgi:uncharacterized surface protein with fasciclin (FAS1) repeats
MKIRKGLSTASAALALGLLGAAGGVAGASSTASGAGTMGTSSENVVQIAEHTPQLSTLVAAIKAAGLVHTLEGTGPFTVFAPTNRAFAALPKGTLKTLLKPANKAELASILTYHVVSGAQTSSQIQPGAVKTVNGASFTVSTTGGKVTITDGKDRTAQVVKANITASNGVIHVINGVLLPPAGS